MDLFPNNEHVTIYKMLKKFYSTLKLLIFNK
jgi:hypothetical protein